ncbi:PBSX family phage terminase large subunit [Microbacterium resistens]|uniref:PBSX family phage terminase large subunit n=1 Tax=Microbacterium resistens TaxID=156977 RepID=A0ABU1SDH7_9MICO|nr:PBSX family phage terminase large subunit [Microbacterium resistens]MDR6867672.1 PBSX family phage terminase large subunit [Microbacterium resistens]
MPDVLADISPKQELSIRESTAQVCVWEGAVRSSKTIAQILRFLIAVPMARQGRIVIMGRTRESIYRNIIEPMMDPELFGDLAQHVKYTIGAPTAKILGRVVHIIGANDKQAEDKIRGMTVALVLIDEITVIPEGAFKMMLSRLTAPNAQLFGSTNPDSPGHWLKRDYLDRLDELPNWKSWHFTLDDNIALSDQVKANLKANYTGLWYRRFILGEWVAAEGAIFDMFDPKVGAGNVIQWEDLPEMRELIAVSLDYGTTNPTAALLLGVSAEIDHLGRPTPRLFFIDEYRHDGKHAEQKLTDAELGREFVRWLNENHLPSNTSTRLMPRYTILDPSAASFGVELRKTHSLTTTPADNDVLYGIRTMASLIAEKQVIITDRCKGLIRELPGYSWDPEATLKGEDKPLKVNDHSTDAARYALTTTENIWRRYIKLAA